MSKKLSLESLTKKLKNVANTQDSIPMFSLWIIHHKVHYKLIVDTWLNIMKSSKPKHRLTLLYLANDVIQSCRRKKADVFKDYFGTVMPEAIALLRDKAITSGVERVLHIWSSRKIYDIEIIDQLHAALLTNRTPDTLRQKLLAEYKPSLLVEKVEDFKKTENLIISDEKKLKNINVDASSTDSIHKLKDKVGGEVYSKNFEESAHNIEHFIVQYEDLIEKRKQLIEELNQGAVFYRAQYHEAKIVVNAYQSFDARVTKMKKMLDQVKLKFSPKVQDEGQSQDSSVADMDMSDSDEELGSKPSKIVAVNTAAHRSTRTISAPQSSVTGVNRPGMRGASTSSIFSSPVKSTANLAIPTISNGTVTPASTSKVSTPSASPPSPEGSPDLNISSPPRYPSLESRLADIFSIDAKPGMSSAAENTASDSDVEPVSNTVKTSPQKQTTSAKDIVGNAPSSNNPGANNENQGGSWQNTIPVIGGNRRSSKQDNNFMQSSGLMQDGGSTPLQDEGNSDNEPYTHKKVEALLPPPTFSGDALSFLTKFMGQQTSTSLNVLPMQARPSVSTATTGSRTNVLRNLDIDWSSIQNITASFTPVSSTQNGGTGAPQVVNERDTDYRTASTANAMTPSTASSTNPVKGFPQLARQKSTEDSSKFPSANEDFVVEEEEILVEEDSHVAGGGDSHGLQPVHLSNLKNIPTIASELSPPPRPPPIGNISLPSRKRSFDEDLSYMMGSPYNNAAPIANHAMDGPPRFPRPPLDGPGRRFGFGHVRPRGPRPRHRSTVMASALAEDRYYDMLYDELRPKFPRPPMRGRFPPRRAFR